MLRVLSRRVSTLVCVLIVKVRVVSMSWSNKCRTSHLAVLHRWIHWFTSVYITATMFSSLSSVLSSRTPFSNRYWTLTCLVWNFWITIDCTMFPGRGCCSIRSWWNLCNVQCTCCTIQIINLVSSVTFMSTLSCNSVCRVFDNIGHFSQVSFNVSASTMTVFRLFSVMKSLRRGSLSDCFVWPA